MKYLEYTDDKGKRHKSLVRDNEKNPRAGLVVDPPDTGKIDWMEVDRDLHNALLDANLFTWSDVQANQEKFKSVLLGCLRLKVIALFRTMEVSNG